MWRVFQELSHSQGSSWKTIYINSVIYYCEVSGLSEAAGWGHVPGPGRLGGAVDLGPIRDWQILCMMAAEITIYDVLDEVLEDLAAALAIQTVVHNILDELIAEGTKHRLLVPLLLTEFSPKLPQEKWKWKTPKQGNRGVRSLSMLHFKKKKRVGPERSWVGILQVQGDVDFGKRYKTLIEELPFEGKGGEKKKKNHHQMAVFQWSWKLRRAGDNEKHEENGKIHKI